MRFRMANAICSVCGTLALRARDLLQVSLAEVERFVTPEEAAEAERCRDGEGEVGSRRSEDFRALIKEIAHRRYGTIAAYASDSEGEGFSSVSPTKAALESSRRSIDAMGCSALRSAKVEVEEFQDLRRVPPPASAQQSKTESWRRFLLKRHAWEDLKRSSSMNGTQHADTLPDGVPLPTGKFDHELHVKRMNRYLRKLQRKPQELVRAVEKKRSGDCGQAERTTSRRKRLLGRVLDSRRNRPR
eukprot:g20424.t1